MDLFSHHAYRIHGDPRFVQSFVREYVDHTCSKKQHADITYIEKSEDTLSIDTVRTLQEQLRTRVAHNEHRVVILMFSSGTLEAQNALLKICEEPGDNTTLFFITPSPYALLPTLQSRTEYMEYTHTPEEDVDIHAFLAAPYSERFAMIEPYIEEKSRENMIRFINALEEYITTHADINKKKSFLHTLEIVRAYLLERGHSPKLLLDLCAVYAPRIQ